MIFNNGAYTVRQCVVNIYGKLGSRIVFSGRYIDFCHVVYDESCLRTRHASIATHSLSGRNIKSGL